MKNIEDMTNTEKGQIAIRAKVRNIDIPEGNPFANDKLDREKFAKVLTSVVNTYQNGAVIALNGTWGTGKTTFVKMWKQRLKSNDFPVIYYNAWEDDISEEPLLSLLRNLNEIAKDHDDERLEKVLKIGARILAGIVVGAAKAAFGRVGEIAAEAGKGAMDALQEQFTESLKKKDETTQLMRDFKNALEEYVAFVCDKGKPLVYFIDELDRCNPAFAVKVLERIKHLFDVPNVVFVLSIDKQQLAYSINGFYGSDNINSKEYLRRFIDIEYNLPEQDPKDFCDYLYDYYGFSDFTDNESRRKVMAGRSIDERESLLSIAKLIVKYKHLNLRQTERIFALARIALCEMSPNSKLFADIFFLLAYLKVCEQEVFEGIDTLKYRLQELIDVFESLATDDLIKDDEKGYACYLVAVCHLLFCYAESISEVYRNPDPRHETIYDMHSSEHSSNITFNKFNKEQAYSIMYHYHQRRPDMTCRIEHFTRKLSLLEFFQIE